MVAWTPEVLAVMKVKTCEFNGPDGMHRSTSLSSNMFNQDVWLRFEVGIKGTDRIDIESMLNLFEETATEFRETWQKTLAELH